MHSLAKFTMIHLLWQTISVLMICRCSSASASVANPSARKNITLSCSKSPTPAKLHTPVDLSWREYVEYVYDTKEYVDKKEINFLYAKLPIEVQSPHWEHKKPLNMLDRDWGDTYFQLKSRPYADNSWVEVSRYSTSYLNRFRGLKPEWTEGLGTGYPRVGFTDKIPYGCWFNMAKGSGISVNVGRTLVATDKYKSTLFKELRLTSMGCLPSLSSSSSSTATVTANNSLITSSDHSTTASSTFNTSRFCYDRFLCTAALALGYDSIQLIDKSELVICSGACATQVLRDTCPPLPLRRGVIKSGASSGIAGGVGSSASSVSSTGAGSSGGGSRSTLSLPLQKCDCSDDYYLLNCGGKLVPGAKIPPLPAASIGGSTSRSHSSKSVNSAPQKPALPAGVNQQQRHKFCFPRNPSELSAASSTTAPSAALFNLTLLFTAGIATSLPHYLEWCAPWQCILLRAQCCWMWVTLAPYQNTAASNPPRPQLVIGDSAGEDLILHSAI